MKKNFKLAFVYDLDPNKGLGHLIRTTRLISEFRRNGIECFLALEKKHKDFHKKIIKNERPIYFEKTVSSFKAFLKVLKTIEVEAIVIDSYSVGFKWEKFLRDGGLFVIALDDHLKIHAAHLVFTNKPKSERRYQDSNSQKWFMGPEFALLADGNRRPTKVKKSIKNILLHAGGSSLFKLMKNFTTQTIEFANSHRINLSIICTTEEAKRYIEDSIAKRARNSRISIVPFKKDLGKELHNYDVVAGPSGTTTFETILAGSFPFTFQLKDDGRDSIRAFNQLGHLMHLDYHEKESPIIVADCWKLILNKKFTLASQLSVHSGAIDGQGVQRTVEYIFCEMNQKNKRTSFTGESPSKSLSDYVSMKSNLNDIRDFLAARNQESVRRASTKSDHLISWPEHLNWWFTPNIRKFSFKTNGKNIGYFWVRTHSYPKGNYLTSGWFLNETSGNNLRLAKELTAYKVLKVKRYYANYLWIIIMRRNNEIVKKLNTSCGFKIARKATEQLALENFLIDPRDYIVMEMKL